MREEGGGVHERGGRACVGRCEKGRQGRGMEGEILSAAATKLLLLLLLLPPAAWHVMYGMAHTSGRFPFSPSKVACH